MRLLTLALATLFGVAPLQAALNREVTLDSIRIVENTQGWGRHTEFGPYQMTAWVRAKVGGHDRAAANRWLNHICAELETHHLEATPWRVAACWNSGIGSVLRDSIPISTWAYSNRVVNIYESLLARQPKSPTFVLTLTPQHRFLIP